MNFEKLDLIPSQVFKYADILFLMTISMMTPLEDRIANIQILDQKIF